MAGAALVAFGSWILSRGVYFPPNHCHSTVACALPNGVPYVPWYLALLIVVIALISLGFLARPRVWWIGLACALIGTELPAAVWTVEFLAPRYGAHPPWTSHRVGSNGSSVTPRMRTFVHSQRSLDLGSPRFVVRKSLAWGLTTST